MATTIPNPHDLIFKQFYGNPQAAAEFLRHNLPPDMAQAIDFSTITPVRDSFVSQDLQACFADLIFSCTLAGGAPGSIYLLFEHKSAPDHACALQVLRYMVMLWEVAKPRHNEMLPAVIPVVIYHGLRRWNGRQLREFFPSPSPFEACIPAFELTVFDLSHLPAEAIKGDLSGKALLLLLKAMHSRQPEPKIAELFTLLFSALGPDTALQSIEQFMRYIFGVNDRVTRQSLEIELLKTHQGEYIMKSVAQKIFPEAYTEGLLAGRSEGRNDLLLRLLRKRFGQDVRDIRVQERLRQATPEELDIWAERILDAKTLQDVFGPE